MFVFHLVFYYIYVQIMSSSSAASYIFMSTPRAQDQLDPRLSCLYVYVYVYVCPQVALSIVLTDNLASGRYEPSESPLPPKKGGGGGGGGCLQIWLFGFLVIIGSYTHPFLHSRLSPISRPARVSPWWTSLLGLKTIDWEGVVIETLPDC